MGKNDDKDQNGRGVKPSDNKERGQRDESLVSTQPSDLQVDSTQIEKKVRSRPLPQFSSVREANPPKRKKTQDVFGGPRDTRAQKTKAVSDVLHPVATGRKHTVPETKKHRLEKLSELLGPVSGEPPAKKALDMNEGGEPEERPPESGSVANPKRNRCALPPLAVELITHARREGVSAKKLLLTGRAYELFQQARDHKRKDVMAKESKKNDGETKRFEHSRDIKKDRTLEKDPKKPVVESKQTTGYETIPKEREKSAGDRSQPASPMPSSSPRTPASRLTTPDNRSSISPHRFTTSPASPASTTWASSSASTPVKLPTAAKPVTVATDGKVTFQTPESYATYVHSLKLLENSHKRKAAKKEKKRQDQ